MKLHNNNSLCVVDITILLTQLTKVYVWSEKFFFEELNTISIIL